MHSLLGYIAIIALFWFVLYWVIGGVLFGVVAILQVSKLRRARFSSLFTLASAACAFAAAYYGTKSAHGAIRACLEQANEPFSRLASVIACGILEQVASGVGFFVVLMALGVVIFILSRATNQSWIDSHEVVDAEDLDIIEI